MAVQGEKGKLERRLPNMLKYQLQNRMGLFKSILEEEDLLRAEVRGTWLVGERRKSGEWYQLRGARLIKKGLYLADL